MTIGRLAERTGVPASTIRYWERIGVLPKPMRTGYQRRYSEDAVERVAVLRLAQACGFRLEEIRDLLHGFGPAVDPAQRWRQPAQRKQYELDARISRLQAMRRGVDCLLECQCAELSECGRMAAFVMEAAQ